MWVKLTTGSCHEQMSSNCPHQMLINWCWLWVRPGWCGMSRSGHALSRHDLWPFAPKELSGPLSMTFWIPFYTLTAKFEVCPTLARINYQMFAHVHIKGTWVEKAEAISSIFLSLRPTELQICRVSTVLKRNMEDLHWLYWVSSFQGYYCTHFYAAETTESVLIKGNVLISGGSL